MMVSKNVKSMQKQVPKCFWKDYLKNSHCAKLQVRALTTDLDLQSEGCVWSELILRKDEREIMKSS